MDIGVLVGHVTDVQHSHHIIFAQQALKGHVSFRQYDFEDSRGKFLDIDGPGFSGQVFAMNFKKYQRGQLKLDENSLVEVWTAVTSEKCYPIFRNPATWHWKGWMDKLGDVFLHMQYLVGYQLRNSFGRPSKQYIAALLSGFQSS